MNLETSPAHRTICDGELNLITPCYFPNEARRTIHLEVVHGPAFKTDCASCLAGIKYIKQAFAYLNGGTIVWNQTVTEQTQEKVVVVIGNYKREILLASEKVCMVPVDPTLKNLLGWFVKQFQGQLELSHASIISMTCEGETESLNLWY